MNEVLLLEWWHWVLAGIGLVLLELVVPSFFIIWFGLAALLLGLLLWVLPGLSLTAQITIWALASVAMTALWFKLFKPSRHKTLIGTAAGEVIGEVGLMVAAVAPFERGRVRFQRPVLGAEEWACVAEQPIAAGERVRLLSVEGSYLKVTKA